MRTRVLCVSLLAMTMAAHAETAVQPGLWEKTETVTVDSAELPSRPRSICLKADDANLERLVMINDDEAKARGCKRQVTRPGEGRVVMSMSCPASDGEPAVEATAEVRYSPTSFAGSGQVLVKGKDGQDRKGSSVLAGKRVGDC